MTYENIVDTNKAMNKMVTPIDSGFIIIIMFIESDEMRSNNVKVIYNYEYCTHSLNIKGLCALYTILYVWMYIYICAIYLYYDLHQ